MIRFPRGAPHGVKRRLWERDVRRSNFEGITRSEARLHKINLSSFEHGYNDLLKLGGFKDASNFGWQNRNYDRKYTRHFKDFYLNAFVNPNTYRPRMMIYIYPRKDPSPEKYKQSLNQLYSSLPRLNVSKVEYAIDLFCGSPHVVRGLFEFIRKHLYIPSQQKINMIDDYENNPHLSRVYHIGKSFKVYERGNDNKKKEGNCWHYKDFDRVRLEFTGNKTSLKKHGIETLKDLIDDPKFIYVNWDKWLFKYFKYTKRSRKRLGPYGKRLPAPYERYSARDKSGVSGTYYSEYFKLKEKLTNYSDYIGAFLRQCLNSEINYTTSRDLIEVKDY